jgi:hypothetical protein
MKIPSFPLHGWPGFALGWAAGLGALLLAGASPARSSAIRPPSSFQVVSAATAAELDRRARALESVDASAPNYLECYWAARAIRDELSRRAGAPPLPR